MPCCRGFDPGRRTGTESASTHLPNMACHLPKMACPLPNMAHRHGERVELDRLSVHQRMQRAFTPRAAERSWPPVGVGGA
eukprot:4924665-Prymnesium_polylepis.1